MGPSFGVNLFVWSALLAVTLGSLATGYYAGGVAIDRLPSARLLGLTVIAGGVLLSPCAARQSWRPDVRRSTSASGRERSSVRQSSLLPR